MAIDPVFIPGKVRLNRCKLAGTYITQWVQNIKVYESMCTPYIKSDITVVDNGTDRMGTAGIIKGISAQTDLPGAPVDFSFHGGDHTYVRNEQVVLTVDSQPAEENKRTRIYNIGTIGASYRDDKQGLVQKQFVNISAIQAAKQVHQEYLPSDPAPVNTPMDSQGPIAKDTIGSYTISNKKPFAAIEELLHRATYAGLPCPTVYYRDADAFVMAPLFAVFLQASPQHSFTEYGTLGIDTSDIFDSNGRGHNSIIASSVIIKEDDLAKGGRNQLSTFKALTQQHTVFDWAKNIMPVDLPGGKTGGGFPNVLNFNSYRNDLSHDPSMCKPQSEEFLARVKDADKYLVKVPIRYGSKVTVGKGVQLRMIAAGGSGGDSAQVPQSMEIKGVFLVADVMHDCYFDHRTLMGTTTMRVVKVSDVMGGSPGGGIGGGGGGIYV